jgi:hypothetical protein
MQVSNRVRDREVMVGRITAAHKAALLLESRLEVMLNDLTPGNGLAQAYEQLMALKGTKVFLLSLLDRFTQEQ